MTPEITYFIKVNLAIILFYIFYRSFCTQDTFFRWRRITLLCFWATAWIYPLMNLQNWIHQQVPMQELATFYAQTLHITPFDKPDTSTNISWEKWGLIVYLAGVTFLGLRFLVQLFSICRLARKCPKEEIAHTQVRILPKEGGPFSFFQWIFVHSDALKHTHETEEILTHERTHVREWHSIDVLFSELNCILCWMNPFSWLLKQEVRNNLEYLADQKVIRSGHDTKSYQYHLLGLAYQKAAATLYNHFNVLPIKKRIIMMNKKRTQNIGRTKYCMFFLLATVLMLLSNIESVARNTEKMYTALTESLPVSAHSEKISPAALVQTDSNTLSKKETPLIILDGEKVKGRDNLDFSQATNEEYAKYLGIESSEIESVTVLKGDAALEAWGKEGKNGVIQFTTKKAHTEPQKSSSIEQKEKEDPDKIYETVEEMPNWKDGGTAGLYKYISDNLQYPKIAQKEKVQGKVFVRLTIEKDGSVSAIQVIRSLSPETDKEVVRVIQSMPKWSPGKMKGEPVRTYFVLPITFRLD